ncbi:MAG: Mur ligase family protein, partial [Candidatus Limnocylindrales bacterium]
VIRLHALSGAGSWLGREGRSANLRVAMHRSSEPGDWIVAFPWRERERAEAIASAAIRLVELGIDLEARPADGQGGSRSLAQALRGIADAGTTTPPWIRDADRRVPAVSISGTNGKSTTTRMLTHILRVAGRHVGTTTSDGVLFDEVLIEAGDLTGPGGARTVLTDPRVDVAVLETARGGMVLRGIGYESNDVSVLTNVSSDHLDLHGIHTLPELAEVKATVARITKPDGVAVLNADDPLVAAVARRIRATPWFFSMDPASARVRRHTAAGGGATIADGDWIMEVRGTRRRRVVAIAEVPAAVLGLARHNVANALAAAAAARALGATIEQVADGLRTFQPTAEQAPGRLNFYAVGRRIVVVDFAHNEAGVDVVLGVAEGLAGTRDDRAGKAFVSIVVGTAGDRPDDTLRGIGRIAAARADDVAIKETITYLRGRTRQSVIGELAEGIREGGGRMIDAPVYEDEPSAVRGELTDPSRMAAGGLPGVLVIMCHADRDGVVEAITGLGGTPVSMADLVAFQRGALRGLSPPGPRIPRGRR